MPRAGTSTQNVRTRAVLALSVSQISRLQNAGGGSGRPRGVSPRVGHWGSRRGQYGRRSRSGLPRNGNDLAGGVCLLAEPCPVVHQPPALVEQVAPSIGFFDLVGYGVG